MCYYYFPVLLFIGYFLFASALEFVYVKADYLLINQYELFLLNSLSHYSDFYFYFVFFFFRGLLQMWQITKAMRK